VGWWLIAIFIFIFLYIFFLLCLIATGYEEKTSAAADADHASSVRS
jgi:hypothetical protein